MVKVAVGSDGILDCEERFAQRLIAHFHCQSSLIGLLLCLCVLVQCFVWCVCVCVCVIEKGEKCKAIWRSEGNHYGSI